MIRDIQFLGESVKHTPPLWKLKVLYEALSAIKAQTGEGEKVLPPDLVTLYVSMDWNRKVQPRGLIIVPPSRNSTANALRCSMSLPDLHTKRYWSTTTLDRESVVTPVNVPVCHLISKKPIMLKKRPEKHIMHWSAKCDDHSFDYRSFDCRRGESNIHFLSCTVPSLNLKDAGWNVQPEVPSYSDTFTFRGSW